MSFQMITEDEFDVTGFSLVPNTEHSPNSGIDINIDANKENTLKETDRFIFTDKTASKDAYLNNIIVSKETENEEDPENPIYKEYDLTPEFNKETKQYKVDILEYIDDIDIKATLSDTKSSMKIKVPKRDEEGNLVYEADGSTIVYEEKELTNDTNLNIKLNELGTEDTIITITVTAEDKKTTNEYEVTIHRPYGTIKGSIQLGAMLRESMDEGYGVEVKYIADVKAYKTGDFDWKTISTGEATFEEVDEIEMQRKVITNAEDGSYTMYIIPGTYDLLIERAGFLPEIVTEIEVTEGSEIDLGNKILREGDVDRNGIIDVMDMIEVVDRMDSSERRWYL